MEKIESQDELLNHKSHWYAFFFLLFLGAAARFFMLTHQSFWMDEIYIAQVLETPFFKTLKYLWFNENHPPLYVILLRYWVGLFGSTEWSLRASSALLGTATLPLAYLFAKQLYGRQAALLTMAIFTISPLMIYYSQEVRYYALWLPLCILSFWLFFLWLREDKDTYLPWGCITILALFTHVMTFLVLFMQAALFLIEWKKRPIPSKLMFSLIGLILGVFIMTWWVWLHLDHEAGFSKPFSITFAAYIPFVFTLGYSYGPSLDYLHLASPREVFKEYWLICGVPMLFILSVSFTGILRSCQNKQGLHILFLCLITAAAAMLISVMTNVAFNVRSILFLFPFFAVYLALGSEWLAKKRIMRCIPLITLLFMLFSTYQYYFIPAYAKDDLRGAASIIQKRPEIPVLTSAESAAYFIRYYGIDANHSIAPFSDQAIADTSNSPLLFLIWNRPWTMKELDKYRSYFFNRYQIVEEYTLPGVRVQLAQKKAE